MAVTHLALLWRFHQPWYVSPRSDQALLPWVRLHAASTYNDLAALMERHPGVRATVSFSPSLLGQLQRLAEGEADADAELTLAPAAELDEEQRRTLLWRFFSAHPERVVRGLPRYAELMQRRTSEGSPGRRFAEAAAGFDEGALRDLQLLFNLAWVGFAGQQEPLVGALLGQGRDFSEAQKAELLQLHGALAARVLPRWRALVERGQVEAMATPLYHPLMPLLVDSHIARRPMPEVKLPERFAFPEDARVQLVRGLDLTEQHLGQRPVGVWPPEAGVSTEIVHLACQAGASYVVGDGDLLFHSLDERGSSPGPARIYQPYRVGGCTIFFADGALRRAVCEEYPAWEDSAAAAADLLRRVRQAGEAAQVVGDAPPLVVLALPGEKPWESYPGRGEAFLDALFSQLAGADDVRAVPLAEHLEQHPPQMGIDYLHAGSWTEGNFAVWIGDPDKNRAWDILRRARVRLHRASTSGAVSARDHAAALEHLLRAEGSDWFWWLGEPFASVEDPVYEALFKEHLAAMYQVLGERPPADLARPIAESGVVEPLRQPTASISPRIDGTRTSFFEWRDAGFYRLPTGSVEYAQAVISGFYWGFDAGRFYLRLDLLQPHGGSARPPLEEMRLRIELTGPDRHIQGTVRLDPSPRVELASVSDSGERQELGVVNEVVAHEVVEMAIPLGRLGFAPGALIGISLHFSRGDQDLGSVPHQGVVELQTPIWDYSVGPSYKI